MCLKNECIWLLNRLGSNKTPFFFAISYDGSEFYCKPIDKCAKDFVFFDIDGVKNKEPICDASQPDIGIKVFPSSFEEYKQKFNLLQEHIKAGNGYLLNLTQPTRIELNCGLSTIFERSFAPFKLLFKNSFVVSSPERFVKIVEKKISTYPMKGTAKASAENDLQAALDALLNDKKEFSEHTMVVDLLRNDLSICAENVKVEEFRKPLLVKTADGFLWQTISSISGELGDGWQSKVGTILGTLLPAGSVTGAPKRSVTKILNEVEGYRRGFYCGVFGVFTGDSLDSAVAIRFIEKDGGGFVYKSGGGITADSVVAAEYQELLDKVYVPF